MFVPFQCFNFYLLFCAHQIALVLEAQIQPLAAVPFYKRSLQIAEKVLGERHFYVSSGSSLFAVLLKSNGLYEEAAPVYEKSLALSEARSTSRDHISDSIKLASDCTSRFMHGIYQDFHLSINRCRVSRLQQAIIWRFCTQKTKTMRPRSR